VALAGAADRMRESSSTTGAAATPVTVSRPARREFIEWDECTPDDGILCRASTCALV